MNLMAQSRSGNDLAVLRYGGLGTTLQAVGGCRRAVETRKYGRKPTVSFVAVFVRAWAWPPPSLPPVANESPDASDRIGLGR